MGLPTPAEAVRERLTLARWAVSRARSCVAVVAETDASGRRVAPPVGLPLRFDGDAATGGAYGLECALPEAIGRRAFSEGGGSTDATATQVDVEWVRSGAAFDAQPQAPLIEISKRSTVLDYLKRDLPALRADLRPWLGESGRHPSTEDGLPPGFALSATRLTAFNSVPTAPSARRSCGSRGPTRSRRNSTRGRSVLLSTRLWKMLYSASVWPHLQQGSKRRAGARSVSNARRSPRSGMPRRNGPLGRSTSPGIARTGLVDRWNRECRYAIRLLVPVEELNARARKTLMADSEIPALAEATATLIADGQMAEGPQAGEALGTPLECGADVAKVSRALDDHAAAQNKKNAGILGAALAKAEVKKSVKKLCDAAAAVFGCAECAPDGDLEVVKCEHDLAIGVTGPATAKPLQFRLGSGLVAIHGRIDAVIRREGVGKRKGTTYRIVDFKTGRWAPTGDQVFPSLIQPQLPFYALALAAAGPVRDGDRPPVVVEWIGYRAPRVPAEFSGPWSTEMAEHAAAVFGEVLDQARAGFYPLVPHADACPAKKYKGAFCDFRELCRLRTGFGAAAADETPAEEVLP